MNKKSLNAELLADAVLAFALLLGVIALLGVLLLVSRMFRGEPSPEDRILDCMQLGGEVSACRDAFDDARPQEPSAPPAAASPAPAPSGA